jgi:hypothetical protein
MPGKRCNLEFVVNVGRAGLEAGVDVLAASDVIHVYVSEPV